MQYVECVLECIRPRLIFNYYLLTGRGPLIMRDVIWMSIGAADASMCEGLPLPVLWIRDLLVPSVL